MNKRFKFILWFVLIVGLIYGGTLIFTTDKINQGLPYICNNTTNNDWYNATQIPLSRGVRVAQEGYNLPDWALFCRDSTGTSIGIYENSFPSNQVTSLQISSGVLRTYKEGQPISVSLIVACKDTVNSGKIKFAVEYTSGNVGSSFPGCTKLLTAEYDYTPADAGKLIPLNLGNLDPTESPTILFYLTMRVYRDTDVVGNLTSGVYGLGLRLGYKIDTIGSRTPATK